MQQPPRMCYDGTRPSMAAHSQTGTRARRIFGFTAAGIFAAAALAASSTVVPTATGCTTHQCDTSFTRLPALDAGAPFGDLINPYTYETGPATGEWFSYPGQATFYIAFPEPLQGIPLNVYSYLGDGPTPNDPDAGETWSEVGGQLAYITGLNQYGFFVTNGTCAAYYARFVVVFTSPEGGP